MLVQVISAIENGQPLLMENLPEDIDAVLDPVIGKLTFRRGRNLILKVGDAEVEYDPNFRSASSPVVACPKILSDTSRLGVWQPNKQTAGCFQR